MQCYDSFITSPRLMGLVELCLHSVVTTTYYDKNTISLAGSYDASFLTTARFTPSSVRRTTQSKSTRNRLMRLAACHRELSGLELKPVVGE